MTPEHPPEQTDDRGPAIASIAVENLRGIRSGSLEGLADLSILTGPNGCGKSTILDALLIAASRNPADAVGRAVLRHPVTRNGFRWLVGNRAEPALISAHGKPGLDSCRWLEYRSSNGSTSGRGPSPSGSIHLSLGPEVSTGPKIPIQFAPDNSYEVKTHLDLAMFGEARLIDPGLPIPLDQIYSEAVRQGRKRDLLALLQALVPELEGLEILTEDDGTPALYVVNPHKGIPVSLAGDGIQAFVQLAVELAASPGGLLLIEEPEVYQHLRSIRQSAKALLATVRRGVQIVVTTHSLELIDAVIAESSPGDLERVALFNLLLFDGELKSSRYPGPDIEFARAELEKDLR